jgi:hypothetical protein
MLATNLSKHHLNWGEGEKIASQILLLNVTFETPLDFVLIMKL